MGGSSQDPHWEESHSDESSVVRFSGIDQEAIDELELETFLFTSRLPPGAEIEPTPSKPRWGQRIVSYLVFFGYGSYFAGLLLHALGVLSSPYAWAATFAALCTLSILARRAHDRRVHPRPIPNAAFRVGFLPSQNEFFVEGARRGRVTIPLDQIASFEGGKRLSVILQSGEKQVLPCRVDTDSQADLARRLETLVHELRADHSGYRGLEPHVRVATDNHVPLDEDERLEPQEPRVKRL